MAHDQTEDSDIWRDMDTAAARCEGIESVDKVIYWIECQCTPPLSSETSDSAISSQSRRSIYYMKLQASETDDPPP